MIYLLSTQERIDFNDIQDIQKATIQDCLDYFKDKEIIEVDTETEGNKRNSKLLPNPYESKVLCLQLGDGENQFVIVPSEVSIEPLRVLFEDTKKIKILCNSFFDLRFIHHWGFKVVNIYDIFLAEMLLTLGKDLPKGYRGLEQMSERYLGIKVSKEVRGQIHWRGLDDTVIKYAAGDVRYLNDIRLKQLEKIKEYELETALELENRFAIILSHVSYKGFKIDPNKWLEVNKENKKKLLLVSEELDKYLVDNKIYKFLDNTFWGYRSLVNWSSSKQVVTLFKTLGIDTKTRDKQTGEIKDSVDGKHLTRQKHKFPILPIYLRYKEIQKEISTYGESFLVENLNPITGRIHSEFFQLVDTGRISSSHPNLQNIPATDEKGEVNPLRECFIAENKNVLIVADYSQQEPRITADYSQDPYLIDFILNGDGDSHSLISTMISDYLLGQHIKVSKKNNPFVPRYNQKIRDIGKMINLGLDYGKTAYSVKDDLNTTQEEAQKLINIIKSKTPKKEEYFQQWINFVKKNGYIIIDWVTKRRCWFERYPKYLELKEKIKTSSDKKLYSKYSKISGELERFSKNFRIQGTGGSMTKLAAVYFYQKLDELNLREVAWIVNLVHDEIDVECKKEYAQQVSDILVECMIKAGSIFCKTIPMKVDPCITDTWKH